MNSEEIEQVVFTKVFLTKCFLHTASLPSRSTRNSEMLHSVTGHYLQAIVLELFIKIFYELDVGKIAPFTHNLPNIFLTLEKETKEFLEEKYENARNRRINEFEGIDSDITFHPLNEVLAQNEILVKNFKYDAKGTPTNYSLDQIFYTEIFRCIDQKRSWRNV